MDFLCNFEFEGKSEEKNTFKGSFKIYAMDNRREFIEMSEKKLSTLKAYYICHYCVQFKCHLKTDMDRHYNRCTKCEQCYASPMTREEAYYRSIRNKYIFNMDISQFDLYDYIHVILYFTKKKNVITEVVLRNSLKLINQRRHGQERDAHLEILDEEDEEETCKQFICTVCGYEFSSQQTLGRHLKTPSACEKKKKYYKNRNSHHATNMIQDFQVHTTDGSQPQPVYNIQTQNNVQTNINSVNNYNHNHIENTAKIEVKDFMHDIYDHTHLDYRDLSNDFYVLNNFLALILQNKVNHNIFFPEDVKQGAIVYSRENLRKMPCEKAGFILLEKLYKTMENLVQNVVTSKEDIEKFSYMTRYYKKLMNKYRCDSTYREYDPEKKEFYSTPHGSQMRSRDEYLSDMLQIVKSINSEIKETLFSHSHCNTEGYAYIELNPSIEDFSSKRIRNRDLRAK